MSIKKSPEPFPPVHSEERSNDIFSVSVYQNGIRIQHFYNAKSLDTSYSDRVKFIDEKGNSQTIINTNGIIIIEKESSTQKDIVVDV